MKPIHLLVSVVAASWLLFQPTLAWSAEATVRAEGASAESLADLLAIAPPKLSASGPTRGFRPVRPGERAKPYGSGRANLLVTFVTGSAVLEPEARKLLDTLAQAMRSDDLAGLAFRVQGHADARGSPQANDALSLARAKAVVEYLTTEQAILADRLVPEGKGSREPMNKIQVDAPENRRVTVVSFHKPKKSDATSSTGSKP